MSDARWGDPRESGERDRDDGQPRVYEERDRDEHNPRDGLMHDLDIDHETLDHLRDEGLSMSLTLATTSAA